MHGRNPSPAFSNAGQPLQSSAGQPSPLKPPDHSLPDETYTFDVYCGIPSIAQIFSSWLSDEGSFFEPCASIKLIIDVPHGFAVRTLAAAKSTELPTLSGDDSRLVIVTYNSCPEYWEDLWDLEPDILLVNPVGRQDFKEPIARAASGQNYRITPRYTTQLNRTERRMLQLVAQGWHNRAIADELCVQEKTIANALTRIFNKLNVSSRMEAILYYWGQLPLCRTARVTAARVAIRNSVEDPSLLEGAIAPPVRVSAVPESFLEDPIGTNIPGGQDISLAQ